MIDPQDLNRFATFVVSAEMLRDYPLHMMTCMTGMLVLGATPDYSDGTIEYVACGPMFEPVPIKKLDGRKYPQYTCVFESTGDFRWVKVDEEDCDCEDCTGIPCSCDECAAYKADFEERRKDFMEHQAK